MKKNIENRAMPISRLTMFAPRSVRRRKIENGIKGWRWRSSITRKAISRTAAPARRSSVAVDPQPTLTWAGLGRLARASRVRWCGTCARASAAIFASGAQHATLRKSPNRVMRNHRENMRLDLEEHAQR